MLITDCDSLQPTLPDDLCCVIILIKEICQAPALQIKALNKHTDGNDISNTILYIYIADT